MRTDALRCREPRAHAGTAAPARCRPLGLWIPAPAEEREKKLVRQKTSIESAAERVSARASRPPIAARAPAPPGRLRDGPLALPRAFRSVQVLPVHRARCLAAGDLRALLALAADHPVRRHAVRRSVCCARGPGPREVPAVIPRVHLSPRRPHVRLSHRPHRRRVAPAQQGESISLSRLPVHAASRAHPQPSLPRRGRGRLSPPSPSRRRSTSPTAS